MWENLHTILKYPSRKVSYIIFFVNLFLGYYYLVFHNTIILIADCWIQATSYKYNINILLITCLQFRVRIPGSYLNNPQIPGLA